MAAVQAFVLLLMAYAAVGLLFGVAFVTRGIARVDHVAEHAPPGFRLIVLPGSAALWPFLLVRWIRASRNGERP